ncbi:transposase DDE domain protein [Leptospira noguchii str. 1993005606]|nr:transposase DDE domain protein [Leptospira noguchii str. 1993005606]
MPLVDKILLRKRTIIESVNDELKNMSDSTYQTSQLFQLGC